MPIRRVMIAALFLPAAAAAQAPLSAIDWLNDRGPSVRHGPVLTEPPVSVNARQPRIDVLPLEALAQPVGLVAAEVTGLPVDLWAASEARTLAQLIATAPVQDSPAMQTLLYTLLLSETRPPAGAAAAETLLLARLDRLLELGATDAAQELAQQAGPTANPARFARWFDATLLTGDEDRSCAALNAEPRLAPGYGALIFCGARGGDWETAALTLEIAHALELLNPDQMALLDRFLSPDIFEDAPPLPAPDDPDPLTFRLYETIGERLPTASLPRAFATADLRDIAGWKAQLEAAERLARIGALSPNRLLGLYTERLPAASGGIWDRVAALQRFETALGTGSAEAVTKTLPVVWQAMREAGLEVAFAALFAEDLAKRPLTDPAAADLAWRIRLLSPHYEDAADSAPAKTPGNAFLTGLTHGAPQLDLAPSPSAEAIAEGFGDAAELPPDVQQALDRGELGVAILKAIAHFESGARGNPGDLTGALATFRRLGLEDTARRAALQLMLLEPGGT